jgi:hypothetical protein
LISLFFRIAGGRKAMAVIRLWTISLRSRFSSALRMRVMPFSYWRFVTQTTPRLVMASGFSGWMSRALLNHSMAFSSLCWFMAIQPRVKLVSKELG